jgi:uncharacterized protein YkwD
VKNGFEDRGVNDRFSMKTRMRVSMALGMSAWRAIIALALSAPGPAVAGEDAVWRRLSEAAGGSLSLDESLSRAATRHARELAARPELAERRRLRSAIAKEGLADAQIIPFVVVGSRSLLDARAIDFARGFVHGRGMTHLGLGEAKVDRERSVLVVLYVRRLLELAPLTPAPDPSGHRVRGRIHPGARVPRAFLSVPSGEVRAIPLALSGRDLHADVAFEEGKGRYTVEIVAKTDLGPEVLALWTFFVGVPPSEIEIAAASTPDTNAGLRALVDQFRKAYQLPLPAADPRLEAAAEKHAKAVCTALVAAHVSPLGTTPEARARAAGYSSPVSENVAIASSISEIHQNLLDSPSHRLNLLDPRATRLGIGVARSNEGAVFCAVELFGLHQ